MSIDRAGARLWRATAALFVLVWMFGTLLLSGGVAHADDGQASSGGGQSTGETAPKPDKPDQSVDTPKQPETTVGTQPAATDKPEPSGTAKPAKEPRGSRKHGSTHTATAKSTAQPKADSKPDPKPDTKPVTKADTKSADAVADAAGTTNTSAVAAAATAPAALKLAAVPAVKPTAGAVPTPIKRVVQFGRQVVGLANDLALIGVSLVNNLAAAAATAIGPKPFFGVPYNVARVVAQTTAVAAKLLNGTPLNAVSEGPFAVDYGVPYVLSWLNPAKAPAGANDPSITTSPEHPLPIILLNGTSATQGANWSIGAPVLANAGYKVYTFNYGNVTNNPNWPIQATDDIAVSASELATFVEQVKRDNNVDKVILIGHSQGGGIMPEYYINNLHGDQSVSQLIGIAPSNHGTDLDGIVYLKNIPILGPAIAPVVFRIIDLFGPAWIQQAMGSPIQDETYGGGDTRPGVLYTTIASKNDWVVTPYTQQTLVGENVTNIVLQDQYPGFNAGHIGIVFAAPTWEAVLGALAANPAANPLAVEQNAVAA